MYTPFSSLGLNNTSYGRKGMERGMEREIGRKRDREIGRDREKRGRHLLKVGPEMNGKQ